MKELLEKLNQPLTKDDVELRIGHTSAKGFSLLLYKTARTDIKRLNDTGAIWQNKHGYDTMGLLTCTISIYDAEHALWVDRVDVGTESQTEKQKGLYSDSFKRAGFRWGIGLELYNAPFIWVNWEMEQYNNKWKPKNFFGSNLSISEYVTKDGQFIKLSIAYSENSIFTMGKKVDPKKTPKATKDDILTIQELMIQTNSDMEKFLSVYKVKKIDDLDKIQVESAITLLTKKLTKAS